MVLTYLVPPFMALFGSGAARVIGIGTWALMAVAFQPTLRFYRLSPSVGLRAARYCLAIHCSSPSIPPTNMCEDGAERGRGACKPTCQNRDDRLPSKLRSGKGHRDENFPVASRLIHPRHRAPILAFYEFVRTADDIADHATLAPQDKLALLDRLEAALLGEQRRRSVGVALRAQLAARQLSPRHAQDLLTAFRMDVTKLRYRDWDDLIGYCTYSAMPVGRFVLDVHGESRATWPANDALCAALQIINHLQDCGKDYRDLDRVYIPLDAFATPARRWTNSAQQRASAGAA